MDESIKIFNRIRIIRAIITLFLLAWLTVFTILTLRFKFSKTDIQPSKEQEPQFSDENAIKYFYLHRIWFGENSIVLILFQVWYLTAILFLIFEAGKPFLTKLNNS